MKYMGSKARIVKYLAPVIQKYIDENNVISYYEPFCGGCNMIDHIKCENRFAYDKNKYLIALFKAIQDNIPLYDKVSKELYDEVRKDYQCQTQKYEDWQIGNVGFLASFNGRFFDGGYAKPTIERHPNGDKLRDYYQESKRNILKQSDKLKDVHFQCADYLSLNVSNALIYCDPPYAKTKQFQNAANFDYDVFWNWVREMSKNNIVLVSELNAPPDFSIVWEQDVLRSIKAKEKTYATEKLFKLS